MIVRGLAVIGLVALLLVGGVAMPAQEGTLPPERVSPRPADHDLRAIRNIFRYADEAAGEGVGPPVSFAPREDDTTEAPEAVSRVRLVGFVERVDGLLAAVTVDGEVVLLSEGDSVMGFAVVGVDEEEVVLRTPDGEALTLRLP